MATTKDSSNPQAAAPHPPVGQFTTLPQYPEMIMAAIEALNDKNGCNKTAISKQMETTYPDLPPAHVTLLSHHLDRMRKTGQLVLVKNNYMKPDPNAPPKRGRGRPPKPKAPLPAGAVVAPPRPRGRPPKVNDPFAPVAPYKKKSSSGSGRPRGRPPKMAKSTAGPASAPPAQQQGVSTAGPASASPAQQQGVKRGRGRPPKVKPAVAPVAG